MSDAFTLDSLEDIYNAASPGVWDYHLESGFDGTFYKLYNKEGKIAEVYDYCDAHGIVIMHDVFPQLIRDVRRFNKRIRELEAENAGLRNQLRDALERC